MSTRTKKPITVVAIAAAGVLVIGFVFYFVLGQPAKGIQLVSPAELADMQEAGRVTIIDVRDPAAYREGHIPGALSIPVEQLGARAGDLVDNGATIVTYCSCPAEETSMYAATLLRQQGFRSISVLKGGFPEWERQGLARETGGR